MSNAREELRRNEMFRDALQTRINSLTNDFSARDDPYQRAQIADDRQKALAEIDRVTKEIDSLKKQIADIEEEARQAGIPPGWIR
jgi:polyhydroxyalkanoate synthesis regulator phasin